MPNNQTEPITIDCIDCQAPFLFEAGEQEFYKSKGFAPPRRCKNCRQLRKQATGKPPLQFTQVVCFACGAETVIPFVPKDEHVYCKVCFKGRHASN